MCSGQKFFSIFVLFPFPEYHSVGLHHLYNEHLPCISSSHLHWKARLRADRNILFSSLRGCECNRVQAKSKQESTGRPPSPHHSHTHTSKLLALEKHCLVIGQKLHLQPIHRGAGTAEVSGLLQPRCLQRRPGRADVMPSGHLHPWSRKAAQSPVPRPRGRMSWKESGMKLHTPSSPIESCALKTQDL